MDVAAKRALQAPAGSAVATAYHHRVTAAGRRLPQTGARGPAALQGLRRFDTSASFTRPMVTGFAPSNRRGGATPPPPPPLGSTAGVSAPSSLPQPQPSGQASPSLRDHVAGSTFGAAAGAAAAVAALAQRAAALASPIGASVLTAGFLGGAVVGDLLFGRAGEEDVETDHDVEEGMQRAADKVRCRTPPLQQSSYTLQIEGGVQNAGGGGGTGRVRIGMNLGSQKHQAEHVIGPSYRTTPRAALFSAHLPRSFVFKRAVHPT